MSSPTDNTSPFQPSSSPKAIRATSDHSHSPVRHRDRGNSISSDVEPPTRPRLSPTLVRSYNPNDPEHRERQRTMDVDMAIQLSRARSNTVALSSPIISPQPHRASDDQLFPSLSLHEEHELDAARLGGPTNGDLDAISPFHPGPVQDTHAHLNHLSVAHDPALLVSLDTAEPDDTAMGGLPMYQASEYRPAFDFASMEEYAREEKAKLGIQTPISPRAGGGTGFQFGSSTSTVIRPTVSSSPDDLLTGPTSTGGGIPPAPTASSSDFTIPFPLPRARQRKLSQSHPGPRRGKMALFEQSNAPPPSLAFRAPHLSASGTGPTILSAVPSYDNLQDVLTGVGGSQNIVGSPPGILQIPPSGLGSGHDRPYRFSFYSNSLSATIHARSLCELPAEGQTFEDLFSGVKPPSDTASATMNNLSRPSTRMSGAGGIGPQTKSGMSTPLPLGMPLPERQSGISKMSANARGLGNGFQGGGGPGGGGFGAGGGGPNGVGRANGNASDTNTWWLDIQSPTDEEMKLLTKVFSIHPLTTEDILMEETREKIELFRTYYFVCFRSFEQDQYSPTYLEPLNMYIIVFREGILSFHFRPTPHPQNVRRRIKQLKDYISVTSDWISYALIDDITDAFGPLIQSIEYEVDSIDELVLILKEAEQSDMLRRIGTCRKKVMGLLRLMGNKADVVKGLAKRCNENWRVAPTSDIGLYLSDIQDHLITMTQNLNHYEKILSRSHSNYLAQISIEMTDANNQINDVLSKLTALGTVLIPMNLVTGLWGMNVHVPGEGVESLNWFGGIIGLLAAFAVIAGWSTYKLMVGR